MSNATINEQQERIQDLLAPNREKFMRLVDFLKEGRLAYTDNIGAAASVLWSEDPRLQQLGYNPEHVDAFEQASTILELIARINELCGGSLHYVVGVCCPPRTDLKRDRPIHDWFEGHDEFASYSRWGSYLLSDLTAEEAEECGITVNEKRTPPAPGIFEIRNKDTSGYGASFYNDSSRPVYMLSFINVDGLPEGNT